MFLRPGFLHPPHEPHYPPRTCRWRLRVPRQPLQAAHVDSTGNGNGATRVRVGAQGEAGDEGRDANAAGPAAERRFVKSLGVPKEGSSVPDIDGNEIVDAEGLEMVSVRSVDGEVTALGTQKSEPAEKPEDQSAWSWFERQRQVVFHFLSGSATSQVCCHR